MLTFLSKFKAVFACLVTFLCLGLLLCPLQAQAANTLELAVKSPTNPDFVFTGEEAYDITLYLQGEANATYYVSYKIIDSRKLALAQSQKPIAVTLSSEGCGELLLNLASIKGRDTFRADITVTDGAGATVLETACPFSRVAVDSVFSEIANVRNGVLFSTDISISSRYVYLKKEDRINETLSLIYWITNENGQILRQCKGMVEVPYKDYAAIPINLYGLEQQGLCRITYMVTDDRGNLRASGAYYYRHNGAQHIDGTLYSAQDQLGLLYANDAPYDLVLSLKKNDNFAESVSLRYNITDSYGAVVYEASSALDLPAQDAVNLPLDLSSMTKYGAFTLTATVTDQFGNEKEMSFDFSRALATAKPGDLPLVNINEHFTSYNGDANKKLELSSQAGFSLWRGSIPWVSVERRVGYYSMPASVEEVMQKTESLGMEPLIILAYGNDDLYGLPDPTKPGWLEGYVNYCRYIARYFGDRVTYYEIWNEWNHSTMGKTDPKRHGGNYYAMVLTAASKAIRSVNPNAKIIGGAMAGHGESWMTAMLEYDGNHDGKSDAMEAMDGFSYHAYNTDFATCFYSPWEKGFFDSTNEVIAVLNRYGDASTKEIWITESGWSTAIGPGVTEEEQAAYFVQVHTWMLANSDKVDRYFWYDFMNDRDFNELDWDPTNAEHNWGLIHSWTNTGNEPLPYSAKKGYLAASAFNSMMAGAQYVGTYDLGEGIYGFRFQKDGKDLLVAFMDGEDKAVTATFDGDLVVTDMYGNSTTYTGTAQLNLSTCPIYIQGDLSGLTVN